jgi:hypothetical protein
MAPYPMAPDNLFTSNYVSKLKKPGEIASKHVHGILKKE